MKLTTFADKSNFVDEELYYSGLSREAFAAAYSIELFELTAIINNDELLASNSVVNQLISDIKNGNYNKEIA